MVRHVLFFGWLALLAVQPTRAAILKKETAASWDRYLAASESRMENELEHGSFLFIDDWPEARRADAYDHLHQGAVLVEPVNAIEAGHPMEVPHGLIHDWRAVVFVPRAHLDPVLAVLQNFDRYQEYYKPEIRNSMLRRDGGDFKVSMQLYKKSLVTVAIDADFDVHFERTGPDRVVERTCATRLAEVADVDKPNAHEPAGDEEDGYLWRLCDFRRFEEKDGGVYVQLETIGLSRSVPAWLAWIVEPLVRSIPRGVLTSMLSATRTVIEHSVNGVE